jgi:hypothetical protein
MDIENGEPTAVPENHSRAWMGVAVVVIGGLLLANNLGYDLGLRHLQNWWALLLLIPATGKFHDAWLCLRAGFGLGHRSVREPLITGLAFVFVTIIFLMGLSWMTWWPVFLVLGGLSMLLSGGSR